MAEPLPHPAPEKLSGNVISHPMSQPEISEQGPGKARRDLDPLSPSFLVCRSGC